MDVLATSVDVDVDSDTYTDYTSWPDWVWTGIAAVVLIGIVVFLSKQISPLLKGILAGVAVVVVAIWMMNNLS